MLCPLCSLEMEVGGLIIDGVAPGWVPMAQFKRRGLKRLIYTGMRTFGKTNILLGQTKASPAFYCRHCRKIVGLFDVTNHLPDEA